MDNIVPSIIDPAELPAGFSTSDPNASAASSAPQQAEQQQKQAAVDQQREAVLEQALTVEALARLRRIKMVKEQKAKSVENAIVNMAMSGKLTGPITEGKLIEMLERSNASTDRAVATSSANNSNNGGGGGPGSIQFHRKNYGRMDSSDDDDDNDDDLL